MRKFIITACALCLSLASHANTATDGVDNTAQQDTTTTVAPEATNTWKNGTGMDYQAIDGGFGMGLSFIFGNVVCFANSLSGDTNNYVTKNEGWRIGLGGNYRYWLTDFLYVEGQAGIEYSHLSIEVKQGKKTEKNSDGNVGMFLTPRIGLPLFKLWGTKMGIVAGYRWDFNKFKFNKENTDKYFTIGITAVI